jgi:YD repeat-containing protein
MSEPKDPSDPESEHEYTRFYYDQGGRLKQMAFPNGVSRRWEYDLADRVVADITINRFGICDRYFYTYNSGCKVTEENYTRGEFPMAYL